MPEEGKDKGGRPRKYETPEELQAVISEYFNPDNNNMRMVKKVVGNKRDGYKEITIPRPTVSDLAMFCGFCDRQSFRDYAKNDMFSFTIKKAHTLIEAEYEAMLSENNYGGIIFALKNLGWTDKQEVDITSGGFQIIDASGLINQPVQPQQVEGKNE